MHEGNVVVTIDAQGRVDRQMPWTLEDGLAKLASGTYAIERRSLNDGRHCYDVLERPASAAQRRLSERQHAVLARAARGLSGKAGASEMGISPACFSCDLAEVASKVGCTNRTEVVWLAAVLASREPPAARAVRLTSAERHVLELAQRGLSNAAIAKQRCTSQRTVANQISGILVKTGLPTRRALATLAGYDGQQ